MKEPFSMSETGTYTFSPWNNGPDRHYYYYYCNLALRGSMTSVVLCLERGEDESVTCRFLESWLGCGVTLCKDEKLILVRLSADSGYSSSG